ncbi:hypothetical protein [Serratia ficaria]|uniref:hypothetical protein n=1 Tax=Serratia ficaria TaxID=61651 RepID=UPI0012B7D8C3|nr:hypothetical protein [Serratia ficaria]
MSDNQEPRAIPIQELLDVISDLRREVNVLNVAFSYLPFSFPDDQLRTTTESLRMESKNPARDAEQQAAFIRLAEQIEIRSKSAFTLSSE